MQYQLIENDEALDNAIAQLDKSVHLAVDTEFVRTRTLQPQLGLLQICDGRSIFLIDPLGIRDLTPFWDLMADESIVKVLHACGEDLDIFIHQGKVKPAPLFDTQIALAVLGQGMSVGYSKMVNERLGIELDKSESRTDWLARPLTERQLTYAAADVDYLWKLYPEIHSELSEKGVGERVLQEGQRIITKRSRIIPEDMCYLLVRECWRLQPHQLNVLRDLAAWRDRVARDRDRALNFVAKNGELMAIAMVKPETYNQLKNIEDVDIRFAQRYGRDILSIVSRAADEPAENYPERVTRINDISGYKAVFDKLSKAIQAVATENGIAKEFLGSKKQINEYLTYCWKQPSDALLLGDKPDLLSSWRFDLLEDVLTDEL